MTQGDPKTWLLLLIQPIVKLWLLSLQNCYQSMIDICEQVWSTVNITKTKFDISIWYLNAFETLSVSLLKDKFSYESQERIFAL